MARIYGSNHNDKLTGTDEDDVLAGYGGDDTLTGRGDYDVFYPGSGNDEVVLGPEADTVVINPGGDHDTILDFRSGTHEIEFIGFTNLDSLSDLEPHFSSDPETATVSLDVSAADGQTPGTQTLTFRGGFGINPQEDIGIFKEPRLETPPPEPDGSLDIENLERLGQEPTDFGPSGPIESENVEIAGLVRPQFDLS
jgi:hypothetical protein